MLRREPFLISTDSIGDTHVRSSITLITDAAELAGSGQAAVLGCGRGTEIPAHHLSRTFDQVDLLDLNADALDALKIECQSFAEPDDSCIFHLADITGLISQIEPIAREIVRKAVHPLQCLDALGLLLTSTAPKFWRPPGNYRYKLVVCSAVLTQLQATVRKRVESIFLNRFPEHISALSLSKSWREQIWKFARNLEDAFINHLESLSAPNGIIYLSDTVHVCWLLQTASSGLTTEGSWIATRTSRLADYLRPWYEIVIEREWSWLRREQEGSYWGRLYGVQAIVYRLP